MRDLDIITKIVCNYYGIPIELIPLKTRRREIVKPRQIIHYFSRELTNHSFATIGRYVGNKDHATVLTGRRAVENLYDTYKGYHAEIDSLREIIKEALFNGGTKIEILILKILTKYAVKKMGNIPFDYSEVIKDFNRVMSCK